MEKKKQSKMRVGVLVGIVLLLISALLVGACAKAPTPGQPAVTPAPSPTPVQVIKLRMAHFAPETHMYSVAAKWWEDQLEQRTGGRVQVQNFWNETLGKITEIPNLVQTGGVDIGMVVFSYFESDYPLVSVFGGYPPLSSGAEVHYVLPGLLNQVPAFAAEITNHSMIVLAFNTGQDPGINSKVQVKSLADLNGKRVRTYGADIPKVFTSLGMVPVSITSPEIYEALQKGTVDAIVAYPNQLRSLSTYDVAKYQLRGQFTGAGLAGSPTMNLKVFNSLPADIQKILLDLRADYSKYYVDQAAQTLQDDENWLKDKGVIFSDASQQDNDKLVAAGLTVWQDKAKALESKGLGTQVQAVKAAMDKLHQEYLNLKK